MTVSPVYDQYFPKDGACSPNNWEEFKDSPKDLAGSYLFGSLRSREVDFSITEISWKDTAKSVVKIALNVALLSYGVYFFGGGSLFKGVVQKLSFVSSFLQNSRLVSFLTQHQMLLTKIGFISLPIIFSLSVIQGVTKKIIMSLLYPAQDAGFKKEYHSEQKLIPFRRKIVSSQDFLSRDIVLEKNGIRYNGILMGHKDTINNGKWFLRATGNCATAEEEIQVAAEKHHESGFNTLIINGPGVGRSEGEATPYTMGEVQDLGLSFLETAIKAKNIVLSGFSLGGASIGQAIMQHKFKKDVKYLVMREMTFDKASHISGSVSRGKCKEESLVDSVDQPVNPLLHPFLLFARFIPSWSVPIIVKLCGLEMDSVAASKKLQKLNIHEVVVQATNKEVSQGEVPKISDFMSDGLIEAKVSLGYALVKKGITDKKTFIGRCGADHLDGSGFNRSDFSKEDLQKYFDDNDEFASSFSIFSHADQGESSSEAMQGLAEEEFFDCHA